MLKTIKTECSPFTVANEQSMGHTCGANDSLNFPPVTSVSGPYDGSLVSCFGKTTESDRQPNPNLSAFCWEYKQIGVLLLAVRYGSLPLALKQYCLWQNKLMLKTSI